MKTLMEIFDDGGAASAPYNTTLKVQVCGLGDVVNYKNSSGEQRQSNEGTSGSYHGCQSNTLWCYKSTHAKSWKHLDATECYHKERQ